jgi:uncharacterized protein (TIGR03118 family)
MSKPWRFVLGALAAALTAGALTAPAGAANNKFTVTNLVSNVPGLALVTDPNVVNAWGLSASPTSPIWVSNNGTNTSTLYRGGAGGVTVVPLVVDIPGGAPTGTVFNSSSGGFVISDGAGNSGPAVFLFDSEDGDVTGWNPAVPPPPLSTQAQLAQHIDGANFKGLTMATDESGMSFLYAADFVGKKIDVWDQNWNMVNVPGAFSDPNVPASYGPFNVQALGSTIYVAYAKVGPDGDEIAGHGLGIVDAYDLQGNLLMRVVSQRGRLDAPWGLALAPADWAAFPGALLVGNFGNGLINAYDPSTGAFLGSLRTRDHKLIKIDGLWALRFGNGTIGTPESLLFSAGPNDEEDGLFGVIEGGAAG